MLRVVLCDDHPIFREGIKKILHQFPDITVADEAGTGAELKDKLQHGTYDIVVLDISLPDVNGLDVLREITAASRRPSVIILSMHPEEHYALRALKAGASGYVEKASASEELVTAIRKVAQGSRYVSSALAERLAGEVSGDLRKAPHEKLSDREYQVLCLLASGKGIKEIATDLSLSPPTVATYRARVLAKLRLKNTADLIRYAIAQQLVE